MAVLDRIISIVKKDPYEHKRKKLPLKKTSSEKKVLKMAESTIFSCFWRLHFGNVYDVFKINRPHTKILKIL